MLKQGHKGQDLQPRSALTPPRSPAPIKATRPDFPVWAGHFFTAASAPQRSVAFASRKSEKTAKIESMCVPGTLRRSLNSKLPVHPFDWTMAHRDSRDTPTAFPCRNGFPRRHSSKFPGNGGRLPIAGGRIWSSFFIAGAGSAITPRSNSFTACGTPSGPASAGLRLRPCARIRRSICSPMPARVSARRPD